MKKVIVLFAAAAVIGSLSQCAKKNVPSSKSPKPAASEEVADMKSKYTADQIASGKTIYANNCAKCHELKSPGDFTVKSWDGILPDMSRKAKLSAADAGLVRAWVITNARMN